MLKELKNTVVNVKTQEECDELMIIYEENCWVSANKSKPTNTNFFIKNGLFEKTCIDCENYFGYSSIEFSIKEGEEVIYLQEFKEIQGLTLPKDDDKFEIAENEPPKQKKVIEILLENQKTQTLISKKLNKKLEIIIKNQEEIKEKLNWDYTSLGETTGNNKIYGIGTFDILQDLQNKKQELINKKSIKNKIKKLKRKKRKLLNRRLILVKKIMDYTIPYEEIKIFGEEVGEIDKKLNEINSKIDKLKKEL